MKPRYLYVNRPKAHDKPDVVLESLRRRTGLEFNAVYDADHAIEDIIHGDYRGVFMASLTIPNSSRSRRLPSDHYQSGLMLAEHAKRQGLPLVVLTGADVSIRVRLDKIGADKVFEKPYQPRKVISAVIELFRA